MRKLGAYAGNAGDIVKFFACRAYGKTTCASAVLASGTTITLDGDAGVKNTLNGIAVAAADFVLCMTASGWQLNEIAGVNAGGADGAITINSITFYDGRSNFGAAIAEDAVCYIIWAEDADSLAIGSKSTTTAQDYQDFFNGYLGQPCALAIYGAAAADHYITGTAEYVDS